jgi:glycosyltransferase involved in cell wall biosynthesis
MNEKQSTDIIVFSEFCDGTVNSTGFYWQQIAEHLIQFSNVVIVSPSINSRLQASNKVTSVILKNKNRFWKYVLPVKLHLFIQMLWSLNKLKIKNSRIILGTNPFLLPLLVPLLKFMGSKHIVLICYDFFPQNIASQTESVFFKYALKILSNVFKASYRCCDEVIACGRDIQSLLIKLQFNNSENIHYIPNWADLQDQSDIIPRSFSTSETRFLFFGNLGQFQGIPKLLIQVSNVTNQKTQFIFAGSGKYSKEIIEAANLDPRIVFLGSVPMEKKDEIFANADISIVTLVPNMRGCCVPSKVYFSLANGHPILGFVDDESEVGLMCNEFKCGWNLRFDDDYALDSFINKLTKKEFSKTCEGARAIPREILGGALSLQKIRSVLMNNLLR